MLGLCFVEKLSLKLQVFKRRPRQAPCVGSVTGQAQSLLTLPPEIWSQQLGELGLL